MKILVTVKRIPDPDESLKFAGSGLDTSSSKWVPNAFDEYAVETALRLSEVAGKRDKLAEIIVMSVCPAGQRQHITQFLAMGADRGVIVDHDPDALDTIAVSKCIAEVFKREGCDLLIVGKLSQDNEGNQIGQRVAGLLGLPQASFAATVDWNREANALEVGREVDDGVETKRLPLPAVVTVDLRVVLPSSVKNHATPDSHKYQEGPRLASLRGITMAKRKKVAIHKLSDLGVAVTATEKPVAVAAPPSRAAGQRVGSVEELFAKLTKEAKVI
ncbi:MAG: electron transfer flavoprotein subunit beta/FixA family protein [Nannocystaceae bacterium]|nr:electron transfer flavoprotein subunit beta/FixA family protein [Myxococcales bacterium]